MDEQNAVCLYYRILFSPKKEGRPDTGYSVDEPKGRYAQGNKPVTERQIRRDSALGGPRSGCSHTARE